MLWLFLGGLAGLALPVQTAVNTRLRQSTGTALSASMISFIVGTGCLAAAALLTTSGGFNLSAATHQPPWIWAGGLLGVIVLTGNILLFPRLGAVETVVLPIAGQVVMGMAIDAFGLFSSPHKDLTLLRAIGAGVVLAGVAMIVTRSMPSGPASKASAPSTVTFGAGPVGWRLAGLGIGTCTATQSAINGLLGQIVGAPVVAAMISFAVGAAALCVANIAAGWRLTIAQPEAPEGQAASANPWWMWTGGSLGALFVFTNALLVPKVGTGVTVVITLLGMMLGSLIIDRLRGQAIGMRQIAGVAAIGTGVALVRLF